MSYISDRVCSHALIKVSCRLPDVLAIFDKHSSIFRMYRNLECQHHLIQEQKDQRSNISELISIDFEQCVTLFILAHLENEYRKLQKFLLEMSIDNSDNIEERFLKKIPRRLFPRYENRRVRHRIEYFISLHTAIELSQKFIREELHSYDDTLRRTFSIDERSYNSQQSRHRRVNFVLSNIRRDTC